MRAAAEAHFTNHPNTPLDAKQLMTMCRTRLQEQGLHTTGLELSRDLLALMDEQVVKWNHSFHLVPGKPTGGQG